MTDPTANLPRAHGSVAGSGTIKLSPDDFIVDEILGFEPSGEGEHVFLRIEKSGENTEYVARQLAKFARVSLRNVSYAGLKDRHGRTRQWFSIQLPGVADPDWSAFDSETVRVIESTRNARKLRTGAAAGNRFTLVVRDLNEDASQIEQRLTTIAQKGVPNYFGSQRFGHEGRNLERALALFAGSRDRITPHQRGLYLSAARSEIFNRILAERVRRGDWNQAIPGDVFMFPDSRSFFKPDEIAEDTTQRIDSKAIHPSGVLWGITSSTASDDALAIENSIAADMPELCAGLAQFDVETARRPFRLCPESMIWGFTGPSELTLSFTLPAGAFATVVVRELADTGSLDN